MRAVKALKWTGIVVASVVVVVAIAGVVLYIKGGSRLNRHYDVAGETIAVPTGDDGIERGRHLVEAVLLCVGCHGDGLEGDTLFTEPAIATVYSSNLTRGKGGIGASYTDTELARAIRHGVNRDGRGMMVMHSDRYQHLSEADLGAVVAYVKSVPPVDNDGPKTVIRPLGRVMVALGLFDSEEMPLIPAEVVDHTAGFEEPPAPGPNAEYGRYLASIAMCQLCHGDDMTGGPPIEEGAPPAPNIAIYGNSAWADSVFIGTIRSGVTPYGKALNGEIMPWKLYRHMSDEELIAIRRYLATFPAD